MKPNKSEDVVKIWEERAKKAKVDTSKWLTGDKLYEKVFDYKILKKSAKDI